MNENDDATKGRAGKPAATPSGSAAKVRLRKIVVATDFSDCSLKALLYGVGLARVFGAEMLLLHVWEPGPPQVPVFEAAMDTTHREEAARELEDWRRQCPAEIKSSAVLRDAKSAHKEIAAVGREVDADLIIVGNRGRNLVGRALMGATAEKVVRHAPCPVLVVRDREHDFISAPE